MELIERVERQFSELDDALLEIQKPRTDYVLQNFVVNQHDVPERCYQQCLLELQSKRDALRRGVLQSRLLRLEIEALENAGGEVNAINAEIKRIDLEAHERAMLGAWREAETLFRIWKSFPKRYTRAEMEAAEADYWRRRLTRQANHDIASRGRVTSGNLEALRQAGLSELEGVLPDPEHFHDASHKCGFLNGRTGALVNHEGR